MEQYIEAIAHLLVDDKVCSISDIADVANVSRPAASRAVRDLADKELVEHRAYGYVDLTAKGRTLAERLAARHETLYQFLSKVLEYDEKRADAEACRLEHLMDDDTVGRLGLLVEHINVEEALRRRWSDRLGAYRDKHGRR